MRVLVVGGSGHLGQRVAAGLRALPGCAVTCAGRRPGPEGVAVDLGRPATFAVWRGYDAVVNCADSLLAPPDAAIDHVLRDGGTWVETASEPLLVRRLLARTRGSGRQPGDPKGRVLLGAGIFTGVSNLLAGEAAKRAAPCARLTLGIRWSALSAGGGGMVNLVPHLTSVPTARTVAGAVILGPPAQAGPVLPFPTGPFATLHVPFSEASMLAESTPVPDVSVHAALVPAFLRAVFLWTPGWLLASAPMRVWLRWQFTLLRRVLLRHVHSAVELVAVAAPANGGADVVLGFRVRDGIRYGGFAAAAMTRAFVESGRPGLWMPDEAMDLRSVVDAADRLAGEEGARTGW